MHKEWMLNCSIALSELNERLGSCMVLLAAEGQLDLMVQAQSLGEQLGELAGKVQARAGDADDVNDAQTQEGLAES